MKIKLRKPVNWFGPYQLAEALCFWAKKEKDEIGIEREPEWVHNFGTFLAGDKQDTWLTKFFTWYDKKRRQFPWNKNVVKIDYWDTWSMDCTLSPIILPMLKQLKATKHGYGMIDDEDVPKHLRSIYNLPKTDYEWDGNAEARYEWVLDEMIWSFEQLCDEDNDSQFWIVHPELDWDDTKKPFEEGEKYREIKWKVEGKLDHEAMKAHHDRIQRGLCLFGKYFRTLWD
jgi:hypothetical protein